MNAPPAPPAQPVPVAAAIPTAAPQPNQPLVQWEIETNTLNLQGKLRLLHQLLREFHNFNREQCAKLRSEGYSSLSDLINWKYKDIRCPANRGGQQFGVKKIKELQALSWFITDRSRRGLSFDLNLYRQEADQYIQFAEIDSEIGYDEAADKPEKFKYMNWNKWEESVYIYLDSIVGKSGAPLSYVIRKELEEGTKWEELERKVQQIHIVPLQSFTFNLDSKRVLRLLKELYLDTEAETWFRNIKRDRAAMKAYYIMTGRMKAKGEKRKPGQR